MYTVAEAIKMIRWHMKENAARIEEYKRDGRTDTAYLAGRQDAYANALSLLKKIHKGPQ